MSKYSVQGLKCDSRARAHRAQGPCAMAAHKPQREREPETPRHYNFSSIADAAIY